MTVLTARAESSGPALLPGPSGSALGDLTCVSREERSRRTHDLLAAAADQVDPVRQAELLDQVVVLNCRVADAVAARYRDRGVALDDLRQVAYEGLVKAVRRFDPTVSEDLLTFAVPSIRGEVQHHLRDRTWMIRPPRHVHEIEVRIRAAASHLIEDLGREPSVGEVCDYLGLDEADYRSTQLALAQLRHDSLDRPLGPDTGATVVDGVTLQTDDEAMDHVETCSVLEPALRCLSPREKRIVYLRFYEERSQREIASELGVSGAQVGRLIAGILRKLRGHVDIAS